jgi:hypothetical protein
MCVAGACAFPCTGVAVPGDYATLQMAVDALAAQGGTICLGAGTFDENVGFMPQNSLTIIGLSPERSVVKYLQIYSTNAAPQALLTLRGIGFSEGIDVDESGSNSLDVTIESCQATSPLDNAIRVPLRSDGTALSFRIVVDGCDLSAPTGAGFLLFDESYGNADVSITNSWIHDSMYGVQFHPSTATGNAHNMHHVKVTNDTFTHDATAVSSSTTGNTSFDVACDNDLFVDNGLALSLHSSSSGGTNGFFGNTTNYDAVAPGAGDVKADPKLDGSTVPPSLGPGSPDRGAGNPQVAPATDYWGTPRGTKPDIGAVQSQ